MRNVIGKWKQLGTRKCCSSIWQRVILINFKLLSEPIDSQNTCWQQRQKQMAEEQRGSSIMQLLGIGGNINVIGWRERQKRWSAWSWLHYLGEKGWEWGTGSDGCDMELTWSWLEQRWWKWMSSCNCEDGTEVLHWEWNMVIFRMRSRLERVSDYIKQQGAPRPLRGDEFHPSYSRETPTNK